MLLNNQVPHAIPRYLGTNETGARLDPREVGWLEEVDNIPAAPSARSHKAGEVLPAAIQDHLGVFANSNMTPRLNPSHYKQLKDKKSAPVSTQPSTIFHPSISSPSRRRRERDMPNVGQEVALVFAWLRSTARAISDERAHLSSSSNSMMRDIWRSFCSLWVSDFHGMNGILSSII